MAEIQYIPPPSSIEGELAVTLGEMLALLAEAEQPEDSESGKYLTEEVLATVRGAIAQKLRRYQGFFSFCDSQAELCASEIARLQARKKAIENGKERLRRSLARAMDSNGLKRLDAGTCVFSLMPGANSLRIHSEEQIPWDYKLEEIVVKVDKAALKKALESGTAIEGAEIVTGDPFVVVR